MSTKNKINEDITKLVEGKAGKVILGYTSPLKKIEIQCESGHKFLIYAKNLEDGDWCPNDHSGGPIKNLQIVKEAITSLHLDYKVNFKTSNNLIFDLAIEIDDTLVLIDVDPFDKSNHTSMIIPNVTNIIRSKISYVKNGSLNGSVSTTKLIRLDNNIILDLKRVKDFIWNAISGDDQVYLSEPSFYTFLTEPSIKSPKLSLLTPSIPSNTGKQEVIESNIRTYPTFKTSINVTPYKEELSDIKDDDGGLYFGEEEEELFPPKKTMTLESKFPGKAINIDDKINITQAVDSFSGKTIMLSRAIGNEGSTIAKSGDAVIKVYNESIYNNNDGVIPSILGYCRVSTVDQAREGVSLETQEEAIKTRARAMNMPIKAIYRDEGISGGNLLARPGMKQLLEDVRARDYVAVLSIARLSRNLADGIEIDQRIRNKKAYLLILDMNIDTKHAAGRMIFQMIGATAEHERAATSERVSMNMGYLASVGRLRSKPPYGYKKDPSSKTGFSHVPQEQAVIEKIRALRRDHPTLTTAGIARILDDDNCPKRKAKRWYTETVKRIMEYNNIE